MEKFVVDEESGCWLWTAFLAHGYGHIREGRAGSRNLSAHRVAYELFVGPIPEGLTIDHLCRVRRCVNPAHLEAVTIWENTKRGKTITAANAQKKHCLNGHPFEGANLRIVKSTGERRCRECDRRRLRESRAQKVAA